jgi:dienelactone hydrolase
MCLRMIALVVVASSLAAVASAQDQSKNRAGTDLVHAYFRHQTERIERNTAAILADDEGWQAQRAEYRSQLFEMLSLAPDRPRTPLDAVVTGKIEQDDFVVEMVHFQSSPGFYVTGNLYLPKQIDAPKPAVLYVCGHSRVVKEGISYGNKTAYQHHAIWLARNGYVCLVIDSVQLGEIEGLHHGTYNLGMWWWVARGYTPAGVEAWNCIRALDYLESRPEVDRKRLGVTGRSGGGAYSWWLAALDDRVRCAIPVAGITSLRNHVIDGCVEGHCDCMYPVNTYRWDFGMVTALVSPRPLLIANTDNDSIFPLDGVVELYQQTKRRYKAPAIRDQLGLNITAGPHKDTPDLQAHAFSWLNHYLRNQEEIVRLDQVETLFQPEQLQVFHQLPKDAINKVIHESFVPLATVPAIPRSAEDWAKQSQRLRTELRKHVLGDWSDSLDQVRKLQPIQTQKIGEWVLESYRYHSQSPYELPLFVLRPNSDPSKWQNLQIKIVDDQEWTNIEPVFAKTSAGSQAQLEAADLTQLATKEQLDQGQNVFAWLVPRGIGPTAWGKDERDRTQIRRRFVLLGETDDGQRALDVAIGIKSFHKDSDWHPRSVECVAKGDAASWLLYAVIHGDLRAPECTRITLLEPSSSHARGAVFMNILKYLDAPQSIVLVAEQVAVELRTSHPQDFEFAKLVANSLHWPADKLKIKVESR